MTQIGDREVGVGRNVICEWIKKGAMQFKGFKVCLLGSSGRDRPGFKLVSRSLALGMLNRKNPEQYNPKFRSWPSY